MVKKIKNDKSMALKVAGIVAASALVGASIGGVAVSMNKDVIVADPALGIAQVALAESLGNIAAVELELANLKNDSSSDADVIASLEAEIVSMKEVVAEPVEISAAAFDLKALEQYIYDNDGDVSVITEDLDEDEISQYVDRIIFANDAKALAVYEIEKEGMDLLNKEEFTDVQNVTVKFDDDDIDRFKVYDDADEVIVDEADFDDLDAIVTVEAKFEQDDVKYMATFEVEIKDGEVDDSDLVSIELRV